MTEKWFSWITVILCALAAIHSLITDQYINALVFVVSMYNIGMWLWLDNFKGLK